MLTKDCHLARVLSCSLSHVAVLNRPALPLPRVVALGPRMCCHSSHGSPPCHQSNIITAKFLFYVAQHATFS